MPLLNKRCVPCEGGTKAFNREQIEHYLKEAPEWGVVDGKIEREFVFKDFKEAMVFVNGVGQLAEREGHHPDILIHGYKKIKITLSTHSIGGLSENDFILAAKIDKLFI